MTVTYTDVHLARAKFFTGPLARISRAMERARSQERGAIARQRLLDPAPIARDIGIGRAAFDSDSAGRLAAAGDPVILVRPDISTADVAGFAVSTGILTAAGGRTARAALVARQMG